MRVGKASAAVENLLRTAIFLSAGTFSRPVPHECLWPSLKEECVWRHNFASFANARATIGQWIRFYNERRPHQALGYLSAHQCRAQQLQAVA